MKVSVPFCPSCGKEISQPTNFCPSCGTSLSAPTPIVSTGTTPQNIPQPYGVPQQKKSYKWIGVLIVILLIVAAVAAAPSFSSFRSAPKIDHVIFRVDYANQWSGARTANDGSSTVSWSGIGPISVTITRPSDASLFWVVVANAQKQDSSTDTLTLSIQLTNGTIVRTASTSAGYGVVQVSYTVEP